VAQTGLIEFRQLGVLLQGASITEADAPGVADFLRDIETLSEQMLVDAQPVKVEDAADRQALHKVESIERPITPFENNKRALGAILGPSPEKNSKRKTSHAVHCLIDMRSVLCRRLLHSPLYYI